MARKTFGRKESLARSRPEPSQSQNQSKSKTSSSRPEKTASPDIKRESSERTARQGTIAGSDFGMPWGEAESEPEPAEITEPEPAIRRPEMMDHGSALQRLTREEMLNAVESIEVEQEEDPFEDYVSESEYEDPDDDDFIPSTCREKGEHVMERPRR